MPVDWKKYPANWKSEIRPMILARERNRCKKCGLLNHAIVLSRSRIPLVEGCTYKWAKENLACYHDVEEGKAVIVVLTVAHLDHDVANNDPANLAALCQKCHLALDAGQHAKNARETREKRSGQLALF